MHFHISHIQATHPTTRYQGKTHTLFEELLRKMRRDTYPWFKHKPLLSSWWNTSSLLSCRPSLAAVP